MSEFFLELFSEEVPSTLQINARKILQENIKKFFEENEILIKGKLNIFSTPNRLVVNIDKITKYQNIVKISKYRAFLFSKYQNIQDSNKFLRFLLISRKSGRILLNV